MSSLAFSQILLLPTFLSFPSLSFLSSQGINGTIFPFVLTLQRDAGDLLTSTLTHQEAVLSLAAVLGPVKV